MKTRLLTVFYILLLLGVVYLAGHRQYHGLFSTIRSIPAGDKVGHFLLMGLLSFLVNLSLRCRTVNLFSRAVLFGSLVVCLAVTLEELSQIFVRYRSFDPADLIFDYLGIWLFGRAALHLWKRRISVTGDAVRQPVP